MSTTHRTVRRRVQEVASITCDACQATIPTGTDIPGDHLLVSYTFGYGSPHDGTHVEADLCGLCIERLMRSIPGARWTNQ